MAEKREKYENPISVTTQFRFCGNPLRADMYRNCSFQCNYCFAKAHISHYDEEKGLKEIEGYGYVQKADINRVKKYFERAFESDEETKDIVVELLRHRTPIHVGGMSDPFQPLEFREHLTYQLIQLSNKYKVPITFSTKQHELPPEYWEILNPELQAFQISLIGYDADWIKKYEPNVGTPDQRIAFMEELKLRGFWVAMRVQPLIDLEQAEKVMLAVQDTVDYIIIEHLKVPMNSPSQIELFNVSKKSPDGYTTGSSRFFEKRPWIQEHDIKYLQSKVTHCKIGVGDNDFHHLSQSRCCCGIDTIGGAWDTYLKYNLTYFVTDPNPDVTHEELEKTWMPKCSVKESFLSKGQFREIDLLKDYVDMYCVNNQKYLRMKSKLEQYYANYLMKSENARKFEKNATQRDQLNLFDFTEEEPLDEEEYIDE